MVASQPDWVQLASTSLWVLDFNGTNAVVNFGEKDSLKLAHAMTILLWFNSSDTKAIQFLIENGDTGVNSWNTALLNGNNAEFKLGNGAATTSIYRTYTTGTWSLLAFTYADPDMSLSINAGAADTDVRAGPITDYTGIEMKQGWLSNAARYFHGQMAPPTMLSYAMTGAQITDFYTATRWWFGV